MTTPDHPVTLGDLRVIVESDGDALFFNGILVIRTRPATVADLVSALRADGVLVVERNDDFFAGFGHWPKWAVEKLRYDVAALAEEGAVEILDALAEAQPFPPAGR